MYCNNCGKENRDDANYCYKCGRKISHTPVSDMLVADLRPAAIATAEMPLTPAIDESTTQEQFSRILGGRYELKEMLGRGGMGVVYRAHDRQLGMDVAIKFLLKCHVNDIDALASLKREAKAAMQLAHPNIIRLFNFEDSPQVKYLLMEFVQGESLASIKSRKPNKCFLDIEVMRYASEVCEALTYAHGKNIIHRDIKPSNILVTSEGHTKLTDFGVADIHEAASNQNGCDGGGTPFYMSPEQILGQDIDGRSDIYSLGIMMYEMLAGRMPFNGGDIKQHHLHTMPEPIEHVSDWMNAVMLKCLKKQPEARWQSAEELRDVLNGKKDIGIPFKVKYQTPWARVEADRIMSVPKAPPEEEPVPEVKEPEVHSVAVDRTPSPSRSSGVNERVEMIGKNAGFIQNNPEREQARMGWGALAGLAGGLVLTFITSNPNWSFSSGFLIRVCWMIYGGLIGLSIGIARREIVKCLLSASLGLVGGMVAGLLLNMAPPFQALAGLQAAYYCMLCGAAVGAFLGIADGAYERDLSYMIRSVVWGGIGGAVAVAGFFLVRYLLSAFWWPPLTWLVLGVALGFFTNMSMGLAEKPWTKK